MPVSVEQFIGRYQASGLAAENARPAIHQLVQNFAVKHGGDAAEIGLKDANELAKWLVKKGVLTTFQARQLLGNEQPVLRLGDFVLRQRIDSGSLEGWYLAQDLNGTNDRPKSAMVKLLRSTLNSEQLAALARYQQCSSPHLMRLEGPLPVERPNPSDSTSNIPPLRTDDSENSVWQIVVGRLPSGKWMSDHLAEGSVSGKQIALLAVDLCNSLDELHSHQLWAQPDQIDRIWVGSDESAVLICDPLSMSVEPQNGAGVRLLSRSADDVAGHYLAPELFLAGSTPDATTDLYAIGCLLYQVRFGTPPFAGTEVKALPQAHAKSMPSRWALPGKTDNGPSPLNNPLDRVLAHLLAKNRNARFASASDAGRALLAAIASIPEDAQKAEAARGSEVVAEKPKSRASSTQVAAAPKSAAATPASTDPVVNRNTNQTPAKEVLAEETTRKSPIPKTPAAKTAVPAATPVAAVKSDAPTPIAAAPSAAAPSAAVNMTATTTAASTLMPAAALPARELLAEETPASAAPADTKRKEPEKPAAGAVPRKRPAKRQKKKKKNLVAPIILGSLGFILMILIVLVLTKGNGSTSKVADAEPATRPAPPPTFRGSADSGAPPKATPADPPDASTGSSPAYQLVDDDRTLWAAPNPGEPPALTMLPSGSPMIVTFRPDKIGPNSPAQPLFAALAPELSATWDQLQRRLGVPIGDVDRIFMAIDGAGSGQVTASLAVQLNTPVSVSELAEKLSIEGAQVPGGATIFIGEEPQSDAYYFGPSADEKASQFAFGPIDVIKEVAESEGAAVPLPPNLNGLWKGLGSDPDFAMLSSTNFLFADGRSMLEGFATNAYDPLRQLLVPDVSGIAIRMDFSPEWFAEVRLSPGGGLSPAVLKKNLDDAISNLPASAEQFLIHSNPHPSWRALSIRLPGMMRALVTSVRSGVVDGNPVVNFYLPANAAPNLILGSLLAVNTPAGSSPSTSGSMATNNSAALTSIPQMLNTKMKMIFSQESLEAASRAVAEQFNANAPAGSQPLNIVLIGSDLQLEGITQNQQIRNFEHPDSTLQTVLDDLVRRANPDQTATELHQDAQKLLWVIAPDPADSSKQAIVITVRSQAKKKGWDLPPQFVPPAS